MKRNNWPIALLSLVFSLQGFAQNKVSPFQFVADFNFPTSATVNEYQLGGLSGCAYNEATKRLMAISDDRSERGPARLYEFDLDFTKGYKLTPKSVLPLKDEKGEFFGKKKVDFEAISLLGNGNFLLSSEGNGDLTPRLPPEVMLFTAEGKRLGSWSLPSWVIPTAKKEQVQGVRNNLAFEAFTQIPNSQKFVLISEQALIQDGLETDNDKRSPSRLMVFETGPDFLNSKLRQAYVYETDSFKDILGESTPKGDSGVAEVLALNEKDFLVLERSFFPAILKTRIRIFKASIEGQSTDVSGLQSLAEKKYIPVKKELLLDLNDLLSKMDSNYASLDNIESMCWGPRNANNKRTLILMSDSNFNVFQRTQVVVLEVNL